MTLFEFHADLARTANALERIANALERLIAPPLPESDTESRPAQLEDLIVLDAETAQEKKEYESLQAEALGLEPGSDAFREAMQAWDDETRRFRGEHEEIDWEKTFAAAREKTPRP